MGWLPKALVVVLLATGTGLAIGAVLGMPCASLTWGLSLWLGLAIGGAAGVASGVLALADGPGRFDGRGSRIGAVLGLLIAGGYLGYVSTNGPGLWPLTASEAAFLLGGFAYAVGTGWVAGRWAEQVGRAIADA